MTTTFSKPLVITNPKYLDLFYDRKLNRTWLLDRAVICRDSTVILFFKDEKGNPSQYTSGFFDQLLASGQFTRVNPQQKKKQESPRKAS